MRALAWGALPGVAPAAGLLLADFRDRDFRRCPTRCGVAGDVFGPPLQTTGCFDAPRR